MSKSGIPVVSQIGSAAGAVGNAIGNLLSPKGPDVTAPPPVANPDADAETAKKMQQAQEDENARMGRGAAANMYSGGQGFGTASTARTTLLGS